MTIRLFVVSALIAGGACARPAAQAPLSVRMLQAEAGRGITADQLAPLDEGLRSADAEVRRRAVRALGRFERRELIGKVAPLVDDGDARVQQEAINALGQLAHEPASVAEVQALLLALAPRVSSATWPVVAATLGRLPYQDVEQLRRAEAALAKELPNGNERSRGVDGLLGATRGLESLLRLSRKIAPLTDATLAGLRQAAVVSGGSGGDAARLVEVRRMAWLALNTLGVDQILISAGIADPDEEVRRLAVAALAAEPAVADRRPLLQKALGDANPRVRYEALRVWGRELPGVSCAPVQTALRDEGPHVRLLAIDLLGAGCPSAESPAAALHSLALLLSSSPGAWHAPSHALVSLARVAPGQATALLAGFVAHPTWQVRMYAARAAGILGATAALQTLARDRHDNVREAAVTALAELKRPETAGAAIDALTHQDYQLVMSAARALRVIAPAQREPAVAALLAALARISAEQRDTSRDPRLAILERLQELGSKEVVGAVEPYLRDFDPRVAAQAAAVLKAWTGVTRVAEPSSPRPAPPLDADAIAALPGTTLRITMAGKGSFTLRLLDAEAPLTLLRVIGLARAGYYNGLTFHRIAANFVIQGGSPGANEYMGDGAYLRDEVGLVSHRRGTIGISTRGRDTGDAQIFVNVIDSRRLDHLYTVLGDVIGGMDLVDRILEGDVIEQVEVIPAPR